MKTQNSQLVVWGGSLQQCHSISAATVAHSIAFVTFSPLTERGQRGRVRVDHG